MSVSGDIRSWLEGQSEHFNQQIASVKNKRTRATKNIRRKTASIREYNKKITEYKKLKKGIDDMLTEENWEA